MEAKNKKKIKIGIVGAGVSGLTCGIKLIEEGYSKVEIFAKEISPNTTSDVAPAVWRPYLMVPEELAIPWAIESLKQFKKLSKISDSGVVWMSLTEVYKHQRKKPEWMKEVKLAPTPYIPKEYSCSYSVSVPLIDTSLYMPYLINRFKTLGGIITIRTIHRLNELKDYSYLINCSGLGARQLINDKRVFPIRGQVIRMTKPKELNYGIVEYEKEMTYIYPRVQDCIVGSTAEENQWELSYDENIINGILQRANKLCPLIQSAKILEYKVGLRPGRETLRLDAEPLSMETIVIHNYGHGGRGFTLSWGCAKLVLNLLNEYALEK